MRCGRCAEGARDACSGAWQLGADNSATLRETAEAFQSGVPACGRELIARGHSLIVGADALHTADGNAARGAVDALDDGGAVTELPRIMLIRKADTDRDVSRIFGESRPGVFVEHRRSTPRRGRPSSWYRSSSRTPPS